MKRIFAGLLAAIFLCGMIPALAEPVADAALLPLPMGDPNPASRFMFTGQSYIFRMVERDATWNADAMMNVTFEPCCRTDWHSHAGGQILIAVGGIGIHQVEGQEPELLLPGRERSEEVSLEVAPVWLEETLLWSEEVLL